jgi:AcrR family transcriptional regulator
MTHEAGGAARPSARIGDAGGAARPSARIALLDAAVDLAAGGGIGHLSLRRIPTELGTSNRRLIYHFGSKDGLIAAISVSSRARSGTRWTSC